MIFWNIDTQSYNNSIKTKSIENETEEHDDKSNL